MDDVLVLATSKTSIQSIVFMRTCATRELFNN